jgi:hypothetical protein
VTEEIDPELIEFVMLHLGESLDRAVQIAGNHPGEVREMMAKAKEVEKANAEKEKQAAPAPESPAE